MAREISPEDTTREMAYKLWMKAPNPMVTFFKTLDVTNLVNISKRKNLKFNMLMDYCIGRAASEVKEFYVLPVGDKLIELALGIVCNTCVPDLVIVPSTDVFVTTDQFQSTDFDPSAL